MSLLSVWCQFWLFRTKCQKWGRALLPCWATWLRLVSSTLNRALVRSVRADKPWRLTVHVLLFLKLLAFPPPCSRFYARTWYKFKPGVNFGLQQCDLGNWRDIDTNGWAPHINTLDLLKCALMSQFRVLSYFTFHHKALFFVLFRFFF